jgi:hypothetical protein
MADVAKTRADGRSSRASTSGQRSGFGEVPGGEFPKVVYGSVVAAFVFLVLAAWATFGGSEDADLALAFATVVTIVFLALPILVRRTAAVRSTHQPTAPNDFLHSRVEIATGALTGAEVWLQILIIPTVLACAAVAIGAVFMIVA